MLPGATLDDSVEPAVLLRRSAGFPDLGSEHSPRTFGRNQESTRGPTPGPEHRRGRGHIPPGPAELGLNPRGLARTNFGLNQHDNIERKGHGPGHERLQRRDIALGNAQRGARNPRFADANAGHRAATPGPPLAAYAAPAAVGPLNLGALGPPGKVGRSPCKVEGCCDGKVWSPRSRCRTVCGS
ncbi:MAG: hypothetical protein GY772_15815 [bacterium]|nr:hypothetical protein [bacterium]